MRRLILLSALAALACSAPVFAAAPSVNGVWILPKDHVRIRIAPCGRALCGRLIGADKLKANPRLKDKMNDNKALRGRSLQGILVLSGFRGGPPKWTGGRVYNPDDGKTYNSDMTLADPNTLEVTGCVLKPLCKSETLTRAR